MSVYLINIYKLLSDGKIKKINSIPYKAKSKLEAQIYGEEIAFSDSSIGKLVFVENQYEIKQDKEKWENGYQPSLF